MTARLVNVHNPLSCEGRPCVIHAPSDHHMKDWPQAWRDDVYLMERTCEHGIGHPDPDDVAYQLSEMNRDMSVHGCDGCCFAPAVELPGTVPPKIRETWAQLSTVEQRALLPHLLGGTSADYLAGWLNRNGTPVGATTIKGYRRSLQEQGV